MLKEAFEQIEDAYHFQPQRRQELSDTGGLVAPPYAIDDLTCEDDVAGRELAGGMSENTRKRRRGNTSAEESHAPSSE